ncbi:ankyrin repeat-containing domain protein [Aspergillus californicus]
MTKLLELPEELILQIARACPKGTLATLMRASQTTLRICYNELYNLTDSEKEEIFSWAGFNNREDMMLRFLPHIQQAMQERPEVGTAALVSAVRGDCCGVVRTLLDSGVSAIVPGVLFGPPHLTGTPLSVARDYGNTKVEQMLRAAGATHRHGSYQPPMTRLMAAVCGSQPGAIRRLLKAGANPDKKSFGKTPIEEAVELGNTAVIKALAEGGADCTVVYSQSSPLIELSRKGSVAGVQILLDAGVSPNTVAGLPSPIIEAARRGHNEVIETLLRGGADLHAKVDSETAITEACSSRHLDTLKLLLQAGALLNNRSVSNRPAISPLRSAIEADHMDAVQLLLEAGAVVTEQELSAASLLSSMDLLERLVSKWLVGKNVDDFAPTPLSLAARHGATEAVRLFLHYGADVNHVTDSAKSALWHAVEAGQDNVVQILLEAGAKQFEPTVGQTLLIRACAMGHHNTAMLLIKAGANIHQQDFSGYTPLLAAAQIGNPGLHSGAAMLLSGSDIQCVSDSNHVTPFLLAAGVGRKAAVAVLLERGAGINEGDKLGKTALMRAAEFRRTEIVEMLLLAGADMNVRDRSGRTALTYAVQDRHSTQIASFLIVAGCDATILDNAGKSALDYINRSTRDQVRRMVKKAIDDVQAPIEHSDNET